LKTNDYFKNIDMKSILEVGTNSVVGFD
jgi:hypothetical protein